MEHSYQQIDGFFNFPEFYKQMVERFPSGRFLELGTWQGKSAAYLAVEIINSGKPIILDCVDHFRGSAAEQDTSHTLAARTSIRDIAVRNLEPFWRTESNTNPSARLDNVLRIIEADAHELEYVLDDATLDFVFIDAGHEYEEVKADIACLLPKVKPGGVLAGHDYYKKFPGVRKAVDEAFPDRKLAPGTVWYTEL